MDEFNLQPNITQIRDCRDFFNKNVKVKIKTLVADKLPVILKFERKFENLE